MNKILDNQTVKAKVRHSMARVSFYAHKNKIYEMIDQGYSLMAIYQEIPELMMSYSSLIYHFKKNQSKKLKPGLITIDKDQPVPNKFEDQKKTNASNVTPWDPLYENIEDLV